MSSTLTSKKGALSLPIQVQEYPKLTFQEEANLIEKAKTDQSAKTEVMDRYLKMLFDIAQDYMILTERGYKSKINSLPEIDDLASEGLGPLSDAIDDYSQATGFKFITFAERYVRQRLDNLYRDQQKLKETSPRKIEIEVPKSQKEIKQEIEDGAKIEDIKETKIIEVPEHPISLETDVARGDDSFRKLVDVIEDTKTTHADSLEMESFINTVLDRLPDELSKKVFIEFVNRSEEHALKLHLAKELNVSPSMISSILKHKIQPLVNKIRVEEGDTEIVKVKKEKNPAQVKDEVKEEETDESAEVPA